jgi:hypothetical protein
MSAKIAAAATRTALSHKLLDAIGDGRKLTKVRLSQLPEAARTDARKGATQFDGVQTSKFQYGKSTFFVVQKSADDAFDIYDFFSKNGRSAGSQEVDL